MPGPTVEGSSSKEKLLPLFPITPDDVGGGWGMGVKLQVGGGDADPGLLPPLELLLRPLEWLLEL